MRRQFTPEQKAAVAFAALKGDRTINQIASEYEVNPTQVKQWRDAAKAIVPEAFSDQRKADKTKHTTQAQIDELHRVIGVRDAELLWLKKNNPRTGALSTDSLRPRDLAALVNSNHTSLTISRQAKLLGLNRQAYYYQPVVNEAEQALLKVHMDAIDAIYTDYPFYGSRRMQRELVDRYGIDLGRARIRTVMKLLGLEAIYPKPDTSKPGSGAGHTAYPYLLRGITASYPNHIWGTDITYIRTAEGYVYLVAFIDWFSRYVVSWPLQNGFVLAALREALAFVHDCGLTIPDIANSDRGSHFTSEAYAAILEKAGVRISRDGRGRCMDNIFTERLWRSVKYETVFPSSYRNLGEAQAGLEQYFMFYNNKRKHQSLDYRSPAAVYFGVTNRP